MNESAQEVSATRLRIGTLFLLLWFLPFWMAGPKVANALGISNSVATGLIMLIQTAIGVIGGFFVGKSASVMIKTTPRRKLPRKIFSTIWTGKV